VVFSAFLAGMAAAAVASAPTAPTQSSGWETIGHSVQNRPIRALRVGSPRARVTLLVVGQVHGNEPAGRAVVARLESLRPPRGTAIWLVDDANPDGSAAGARHNANDVDLNRNFPYRWQPQDGVYESGSGPASEQETQVMQRFIERERPRVTLWYHQALQIVVKSTGDPVLERLYSARSGLPRRSLPRYHGTAVSWQNHSFPGDSAFVVELPAGPLPSAGVRRHANAVHALARAIAPPREVSKPIPFGAERKADMADYAQRHYGFHDFRLRSPRVIVQHYTVTSSFGPVFDYFSRNEPDPELNELPGVCSHFVIDRDGTIYRLVPTSIMCRHTVGLNWTAVGIEHVGQSDADVMGNPRQLAASLRLTRSLQGRYGIGTRNVIGHNENRSSPYHRERVARLRSQTHADFPRAVMDGYRRRLQALPAPASLRY
jgi:N-acetylmuramoyl-L-alanine amidase-like protein/zinc carboxypeptidase